ncbi:hypothetical protein [Actinomyces marmotae]|uniref:hypothetical protein n=1 Tax=Actinomyces marmotae TaxID=2737173 RepID=UPI001358ECAC|nr:hypothetical protein [Actinomyces marmotae]
MNEELPLGRLMEPRQVRTHHALSTAINADERHAVSAVDREGSIIERKKIFSGATEPRIEELMIVSRGTYERSEGRRTDSGDAREEAQARHPLAHPLPAIIAAWTTAPEPASANGIPRFRPESGGLAPGPHVIEQFPLDGRM